MLVIIEWLSLCISGTRDLEFQILKLCPVGDNDLATSAELEPWLVFGEGDNELHVIDAAR